MKNLFLKVKDYIPKNKKYTPTDVRKEEEKVHILVMGAYGWQRAGTYDLQYGLDKFDTQYDVYPFKAVLITAETGQQLRQNY